MIFFVVDAAGTFGIQEYLQSWGQTVADDVDLILYEDLPKRADLPRGTHVFTALDQLTPGQREMAARLIDPLASASVRTLNHPLRTMRRFQLLSAAYEAGWNSFRAIRASELTSECHYPVFVRMENEHSGSPTGLLENPQSLKSALLRLQFRGYHLSELLVVGFCNTCGGDGLFRKYSAFIVGDRIIPRAMSFNRHWIAKAGTADWNRSLAQEEFDYMERNPHEGRLREVFELAGVQYGRVDYGVLEDTPQVWEINLNPTIAPRLQAGVGNTQQREQQELRRPAKELFFSEFAAALREIQDPSLVASPIPIRVDNKLARQIKRERYQKLLRRTHRTIVEKLANNSAVSLLWRLMKPVESKLLQIVARLTVRA